MEFNLGFKGLIGDMFIAYDR